MTDFEHTLNKAIAELAVARIQGPQHAEAALVQARFHINLALDEARKTAYRPLGESHATDDQAEIDVE